MQLKMLDQSVQVARLAASEPRGHQLDPDPLCQRSEAKEPHLKNPIFCLFSLGSLLRGSDSGKIGSGMRGVRGAWVG
jgi:hypothetical protein